MARAYHDPQLREPLMEYFKGGKERFFQRGIWGRKRLQNFSMKVQHFSNTELR
jgi:hypothetical protein